MKLLTKTLGPTDLALNYAVAKAEGWEPYLDKGKFPMWGDEDSRDGRIDFVPSTSWEQGGLIIERENISVIRLEDKNIPDSKGNWQRKYEPQWGAVIGDKHSALGRRT